MIHQVRENLTITDLESVVRLLMMSQIFWSSRSLLSSDVSSALSPFIPRSPLLLLIPDYRFVFQFPYVFISLPPTSLVFCFSPFPSLPFCPPPHAHMYIPALFLVALPLSVWPSAVMGARRSDGEDVRSDEERKWGCVGST